LSWKLVTEEAKDEEEEDEDEEEEEKSATYKSAPAWIFGGPEFADLLRDHHRLSVVWHANVKPGPSFFVRVSFALQLLSAKLARHSFIWQQQ